MSRPTDVVAIQHWEDTDLVLLARLNGADGQNLNQGSLLSITVKVFDSKTMTPVGSPLSLDVASTMFNTLQKDSRWTKDRFGYNFLATIPGTYFPEEGWYRAEVMFAPVTGNPFPMVVEVNAKSVWSS